mmetsp:Transcript_43226/g.79140  ORF Transcript_43226/g.79140 Transcript_43226/m.79140 type:complete len:109 (-) Transcript_43226:33-359(-)
MAALVKQLVRTCVQSWVSFSALSLKTHMHAAEALPGMLSLMVPTLALDLAAWFSLEQHLPAQEPNPTVLIRPQLPDLQVYRQHWAVVSDCDVRALLSPVQADPHLSKV